MSGFGPRRVGPGLAPRPAPQATAAPAVAVFDKVGRRARMFYENNSKAPEWARGNTVAITQVDWWKAALGAFVGSYILVLFLNLGTAITTPVCVADAATATHTCSTPFSSDANLNGQSMFPDFAVAQVALAAIVFFVYMFAEASSNAIGLGDYDPVTGLERLVFAWFTDGQATAPLTRFSGVAGAVVGIVSAVLSSWALLGNRGAYNTSTSALGTGLGGPELTYLANVQGESYMIPLAIILVALKVAVEHTVKLNSHVVTDMSIQEDGSAEKRTFQTIYNLPHYSLFISAINAAFAACLVPIWGTAMLSWTRDLFNMIVSIPPKGDETGDDVTNYNRYMFFALWPAIGHVIGLVLALAWNKWRNMMDNNAASIRALNDMLDKQQ